MAMYEYSCVDESCSNQWEFEQSMKDAAITTCPKCNKETAKRLISKSNFVLAGGGWFNEGYSSK